MTKKSKDLQEITIDDNKYSVQKEVADFINNLHEEKNKLGVLVANWHKITQGMHSIGDEIAKYFEAHKDETPSDSKES